MRRLALSACLWMIAASPATAQYQEGSDLPPEATSAARLDVRIAQLEEQMRKMQGEIEQVTYENHQLHAQLDKMSGDIEYRLGAMEKNQAASAAPAATPPGNSAELKPVEPLTEGDDTGAPPPAVAQPSAPSGAVLPQFTSARDHYNYAYRLITQEKFPDAQAAFASFTRKYPKDALIGNAYYWLGATYYAQHDYVKAADTFRQGYESMPTGPKAADNLLKLALSLSQNNKNREACVVLKQVGVKFAGSSQSVKSRADQEMTRLGCN